MQKQQKKKKGWPPRKPAKVMILMFDWASRKADYRSYVEEYQERYATNARNADVWAYRLAVKTLWGTIPSGLKTAGFAVLVKLILRN